jgi:hypothetical protein
MHSSILSGILFFILTPGILTRIPKNGDKYLVTFVHSIIFAILFYFAMQNLLVYEGYAYRGSGNVVRGSASPGLQNPGPLGWIMVLYGILALFIVAGKSMFSKDSD